MAVEWLRRHGTRHNREGMARYGLPSTNALGVSVGNIRLLGKQLGPDHQLALALWQTGIYEARMLTGLRRLVRAAAAVHGRADGPDEQRPLALPLGVP